MVKIIKGAKNIWKKSIIRSSRLEVFCKKGVLRNFEKFTGKHLCQSLFFNKVACYRPATLLKKRFWNRCFPVNFAKFLRTPFLQNTSGRLLLYYYMRTAMTVKTLTTIPESWEDKSSHRRCSLKKAVFKNFAISTGKHLYWSIF